MLFFTARPRMSWLFLLASQFGEIDRGFDSQCKKKPTYERKQWGELWSSASLTNLAAEAVLQAIALYPMGRVAAFGGPRGFLKVWSAEYATLPSSARLMYAGAMLYLTIGAFCLFSVLVFFGTALFKKDLKGSIMGPSESHTWRECRTCKERHSDDMPAKAELSFFGMIYLPLYTWMASWIFWAGFVKLAGERYCPPNLVAQVAVWSSTSVLTSFFGASG
ncbi:hypothetical protein B0T14DRAFT_87009 [Immersiella caudata]|uniref:Uncharacterized protein n=1 Tax=Immersiella caudata TaxID=314043 RepID=A0AA40CD82_9PEZI|nr:hypothetical protein B0T14DRAFT_87009 [Immersiella caudata]